MERKGINEQIEKGEGSSQGDERAILFILLKATKSKCRSYTVQSKTVKAKVSSRLKTLWTQMLFPKLSVISGEWHLVYRI